MTVFLQPILRMRPPRGSGHIKNKFYRVMIDFLYPELTYLLHFLLLLLIFPYILWCKMFLASLCKFPFWQVLHHIAFRVARNSVDEFHFLLLCCMSPKKCKKVLKNVMQFKLLDTCGWWATVTLTKCKKVEHALFWKSLPIQWQNGNQTEISLAGFRFTS